MGESLELIKHIFENFPLLAIDPLFEITSPVDHKYNCIAWAYHFNDRWMQYNAEDMKYDGIDFWWPDGVPKEPSINAYKKAFSLKGYEECDDGEYDERFIKIALYQDLEGNCTHAARQKRGGGWTSKLGPANDIAHGSPYSIEGNNYGRIACFMRKNFY